MQVPNLKKALKEFFVCIEKLDFSKAINFFAVTPEIEICEETPLIIIKKGKKADDKNIMIYEIDDLKKIKVESKIKTIVKNLGNVHVSGKIAVVGTDKNDKKRIFIKKDDGHTITLRKKDGKWKIFCEELNLNIVREDTKKASEKVGLCFTDDAVTYIIMRISPSITVVKKEKKKEKK